MAGKEIKALTGLRGVAALVVMAYHYVNIDTPWDRPSPIGSAYMMVDLFFILSGFVMAESYAANFGTGLTWQACARFFEARFARVYPLYLAVTLGTLAFYLTGRLGGLPHKPAILAGNVLLLQNLGVGLVEPFMATGIVGPGWSISTETGVYLLFPALAVWMSRNWKVSSIAFVVFATATMAMLYMTPFASLGQNHQRGPMDISSGQTLLPLLRCLAGFCLGLAVWQVSRTPRVRAWRRGRVADAALLALAAVLLPFSALDVLLIPVFALLIGQLSTDRSPLAQWLGRPIPHRLGQWSYAIYLTHIPVFVLLRSFQPSLKAAGVPHPTTLLAALSVAATIALGAGLYLGFERPARDALRAFFGRRRLPVGAEPSAP